MRDVLKILISLATLVLAAAGLLVLAGRSVRKETPGSGEHSLPHGIVRVPGDGRPAHRRLRNGGKPAMRRMALKALTIAVVLVLTAPELAVLAGPSGPKVVPLDVVANRPVEVGVSTKQLTLIHFPSDVNMVAVGDPSLITVNVKGPDVLVKAQAFSGRTNAFIWVAGVYTQWIFTVRDVSTDPRVIEVREEVQGQGAPAPQSPKGQPVTVTSAYTPPKKEQPAPAPRKPTQLQPAEATPSGPGPSPLDVFVKSLNKEQTDLFAAFLKNPNLGTLAALIRVLSDEQRSILMSMLVSQEALIAGGKQALEKQKKEPSSSREQARTEAGPVAVAGVRTELPEGINLSVTPQVVGDKAFINYVLQNTGKATLLADILRLRVYDADGNRLPYVVTRTSETGYVGRLAPGGTEAGVISLRGVGGKILLEWTLVEVGSGEALVARAEVALP